MDAVETYRRMMLTTSAMDLGLAVPVVDGNSSVAETSSEFEWFDDDFVLVSTDGPAPLCVNSEDDAFKDHEANEDSVIAHARPIPLERVLPAALSLLELIPRFVAYPCYLLLEDDGVSNQVHFRQIDTPVIRSALFALFADFELNLRSFVITCAEDLPSAFQLLSPRRQSLAREIYRRHTGTNPVLESRKRDSAVEISPASSARVISISGAASPKMSAEYLVQNCLSLTDIQHIATEAAGTKDRFPSLHLPDLSDLVDQIISDRNALMHHHETPDILSRPNQLLATITYLTDLSRELLLAAANCRARSA